MGSASCCPLSRTTSAEKAYSTKRNGQCDSAESLSLMLMQSSSFIGKREGVFFDDFIYIRDLGKGAFGETIEARHIKTGLHRAVKLLAVSGLTLRERLEIVEEINILKDLDHPNIMKLYEYYEDDDFIFVVGELYEGGELLDRILDWKHFTEGHAASLMQQIFSAVLYCHERSVVHRDLKPQNILFDSKQEGAIPKIIDFGASAKMKAKKKLKEFTGTPLFMAPEVIKKSYNEKCDIWSCGVIAYLMLSGEFPFDGKSKEEVAQKIIIGKIDFESEAWQNVSEDAKDFIRKLLVVDPKKRYSANEALNHHWIVSNASKTENEILTENAIRNLKSYRAQAKLQEAFYLFICSYFARKEEKDEFLQVFQKLDADSNGVLTREELIQGLSLIKKFGIKEEDIDDIISLADTNGNGMVDYTEFVAITMNRKSLLDKERLQTVFNLFDKDGNGELTMEEITEYLNPGGKSIDKKEWLKLIDEVDKNKDGKISYLEFKNLMVQMVDSAATGISTPEDSASTKTN